jgi:Tol biopolymer transport system component
MACLACGLGLFLGFPAAHGAVRPQGGCVTELVSVGPGGVQANGLSSIPARGVSISADGRWVGFTSSASNLVPGDNNNWHDAFVRDRVLGINHRVSVSSSGEEGISFSSGTMISADGRHACFVTASYNLVPGDTNGKDDCFVHDLWTGTTERVSVSSSGEQGNDHSSDVRISGDGRFVAVWSNASNLVPNDTNGEPDVFLHDRQSGTTLRVNVSSSGEEANGATYEPSISGDGRFVTFASFADNLVPGDTNVFVDVFVHDSLIGATTRISVTSTGQQAIGGGRFPAISADGRFVAFESSSPDLVPGDTNNETDIFVHDRLTGQTTRVSVGPGGIQANDASKMPCISADGRFVAFQSPATNLVQGGSSGTEIFVHDRASALTTLVSQSTGGVHGNGPSYNATISPDGKVVGYYSHATNLVPGDTNGKQDVFVRDCGGPTSPRTYCAAKPNSLGCTPSIAFTGSPSVSAGTGFLIAAVNVLSQKPGLLAYGLSGSWMLPFQGGWLCVAPPLQRTPVQLSGGNLPSDCSGTYSFDFNAWIAAGADPALVAGQDVWSQYWSRDPGFAPPSSTGLTDALSFTISP